MKNSENKYSKVIDKYYNELPEGDQKKMSPDEIILSDKLNIALSKMDIIKTNSNTSDINIMEIIKKGEMIKQNKRNSLEFLAFISFSLLIISLIIILTLYFGEEFLKYYIFVTFIFVPFLAIPLAKISQTGGN